MPLTPADVHNVVFKKPPIGKRGYDEDEVDAFLDVVEAELARLIEENNELRAGARPQRRPRARSVPAPAPAPAPVAAAPPPPVQQPREDDSARASRMLALATETADRYVNEAKTQAEQMLSGAKTNSDRLMTEARAKSEQMVTEAKHRADTMVGDARTRAETMERESRAKAAALEQDAERRHIEAMSGLEEKRSSLERKIEELRTFEREYRTRLRSYLESHLRDLDSRGSAEPRGEQPADASTPDRAEPPPPRPSHEQGPRTSVRGPSSSCRASPAPAAERAAGARSALESQRDLGCRTAGARWASACSSRASSPGSPPCYWGCVAACVVGRPSCWSSPGGSRAAPAPRPTTAGGDRAGRPRAGPATPGVPPAAEPTAAGRRRRGDRRRPARPRRAAASRRPTPAAAPARDARRGPAGPAGRGGRGHRPAARRRPARTRCSSSTSTRATTWRAARCLAGRTTIPLPLDEARTDGFTPCARLRARPEPRRARARPQGRPQGLTRRTASARRGAGHPEARARRGPRRRPRSPGVAGVHGHRQHLARRPARRAR